MEHAIIKDVIITPLKIINTNAGNVYHALKVSDQGFLEFGEVYFSEILPGKIKAWKRHREMVLNIVVPIGSIRFVIYDDRPESVTIGQYQVVELSNRNYCRLTIPPMLWLGFKGCGNNKNMLLNIASIPHSQKEMDHKPIEELSYDWNSM